MTEADVPYRLIMFIGPSGAGKSTLSRWLHDHLVRHSVPATLLTEEAVYGLSALQSFTEEWNRTAPGAIRTLLDAVGALCTEWSTSRKVWITDTFLPAIHWLVGKYPPEQIRSYLDSLAAILAPLHPLLVSLEADVHVAWQRAVADRGPGWSDWMLDLFTSRDFLQDPYGPIQDLDDLLWRLARVQDQSRSLLAHWRVRTLVLDTTTADLDQLKVALLQEIGLDDRDS